MASYHYCCVPQCQSWPKRNSNISFYQFPVENKQKVYVRNKFGVKELVDRREVWIQRLKIGKLVDDYMKVCSRHFIVNDFCSSIQYSRRVKILKKTAIPSRNLPVLKQSKPPFARCSLRTAMLVEQKYKNTLQNIDFKCSKSVRYNGYNKEDLDAAESLILLQSKEKQ